MHPETIVKIRRHLGIIRKVDRVEQSMRHLGFAVGVLLGRFDAQTGGLVDLASERLKEKSLEREENAPKPLSGGMYFTSLADLRNSIGSSVSMVEVIKNSKESIL